MSSIWRFLADPLDLMQHRRTQEIHLAGDHNSVRTDPVNRKLADNRFEFVRCSEYLHP